MEDFGVVGPGWEGRWAGGFEGMRDFVCVGFGGVRRDGMVYSLARKYMLDTWRKILLALDGFGVVMAWGSMIGLNALRITLCHTSSVFTSVINSIMYSVYSSHLFPSASLHRVAASLPAHVDPSVCGCCA